MGSSASDFDCACNCDDDRCKYGEGHAGSSTRAPECPWQEEEFSGHMIMPTKPRAVGHTVAAEFGPHARYSPGPEPDAYTVHPNHKVDDNMYYNSVTPNRAQWGSPRSPEPLASPLPSPKGGSASSFTRSPTADSGFSYGQSSPMQSPSSPSAPTRQSCEDLLNDGYYLLHFDFRPGDRFGLDLVSVREPQPSGLLVVSHVDQSGTFSRTMLNSPGLYPGDVIREVNGVRGTCSDLREVVNQVATCSGQLNVIVQPRPSVFNVLLVREGPMWKKLGLSVAIDKDDTVPRMRVRTVRDEGLVPRWNDMNGCCRVCRGDWITHVNRSNTSTEEMYGVIQAATQGQTLEFRIQTLSRDAPRSELNVDSPGQ